MEANLNRAPIDASDPDNLDFAEVENADWDITALSKDSNGMKTDLEEKQNKEAYQDTMDIDIKNIQNFKISTNFIQSNGGQSTKLYKNSSLMKLTFSKIFFWNIARII